LLQAPVIVEIHERDAIENSIKVVVLSNAFGQQEQATAKVRRYRDASPIGKLDIEIGRLQANFSYASMTGISTAPLQAMNAELTEKKAELVLMARLQRSMRLRATPLGFATAGFFRWNATMRSDR
jgi:hypothetical protein